MGFECLAGDPAVLENMPDDFTPMNNIGAKPITPCADFGAVNGMNGQSIIPELKVSR